jgi:hypothetical protein
MSFIVVVKDIYDGRARRYIGPFSSKLVAQAYADALGLPVWGDEYTDIVPLEEVDE